MAVREGLLGGGQVEKWRWKYAVIAAKRRSTACECPQRLLISIGDFFPDAAFSPKTPGSAEYET